MIKILKITEVGNLYIGTYSWLFHTQNRDLCVLILLWSHRKKSSYKFSKKYRYLLVDLSILRGKNLKHLHYTCAFRDMVNLLLCERNTIYLKSKEGLVKISFRENCTIRESAASAPVGSSSDEARGLPPIVYSSRRCRTSPYECSIALSTYLERIICQIEISILVFSRCAACSVQTYMD